MITGAKRSKLVELSQFVPVRGVERGEKPSETAFALGPHFDHERAVSGDEKGFKPFSPRGRARLARPLRNVAALWVGGAHG
jgi:hypothetical protein